MIVKVTAYVHAFKDWNNEIHYRIDSFPQCLTKNEATVCKTDFMVEISDDFDLEKEIRLSHSETVRKELEAAEERVKELKKRLVGEA